MLRIPQSSELRTDLKGETLNGHASAHGAVQPCDFGDLSVEGTASEGPYKGNVTGQFKKFTPERKIFSADFTIDGPDGKLSLSHNGYSQTCKDCGCRCDVAHAICNTNVTFESSYVAKIGPRGECVAGKAKFSFKGGSQGPELKGAAFEETILTSGRCDDKDR